MTRLSRELVFLILQFLGEGELKESMHKLEQESGFFFNMKYFEDEVNKGNWDEVEKYVSGFTRLEDNEFSSKLYFYIRKQNYLEALYNHDLSKAVNILVKDLKVFAKFNEGFFKELTQLLTLENIRESNYLRTYGDTKSVRANLFAKLKNLIEANTLFGNKMKFPNVKDSRLWSLINESLNLQHQSNSDVRPLSVLGQTSGAHVQPTLENLIATSLAFGAVSDDIHKTVVRTLNQGSLAISMDFHPIQQSLLLVGTNVGDIALWEVTSGERLLSKIFKEIGVSVNRVIWSPDGALFGVGYSRRIVQIYSHHGKGEIRQHLEIDAHDGGVNDVAFSRPNNQLWVITCGDDMMIKVWDAGSGARKYTMKGHQDAVYSVWPHCKDNTHVIFSTSLDGQIKAWLYDNMGSRVDHQTPGRWCTNLIYSADGKRVFSCWTTVDAKSSIVEWDESTGTVKRNYEGLSQLSLGTVQFDTTKNRFLAAGDDFSIKFWDMDNVELLTTVYADGCLPATPHIRFNKNGTLLAASALLNGIKILANGDGIRMLHTLQYSLHNASSSEESKPLTINFTSSPPTLNTSSSAVPIAVMDGDTQNLVDIKPRISQESNNLISP